MKRTVLAIIPLGISVIWLWPGPFASPATSPSPAELESRVRALAGARILRDQSFNAATIDFSKTPGDHLIDSQTIACRFIPTDPSGTTPKFDCRLQNGQKIKVKYGWTREIPAEVAATRLLNGLGFGADRMWRVSTVRCFGCVAFPFHVRMLAQQLHLGGAFDRHLNYDHAIDFVNVAVERKLDGDVMEAGGQKGWAFYELSHIDPAHGGAIRAEVDALRLMAVFLNHWDNKAPNQRLLCQGAQNAPCDHPLAIIQDTGSDFGPSKLNLKNWRKRPIWSDAATCRVSMSGLPYDGATFPDAQISEAGRRLLADRLTQLSQRQIRSLFMAAGFTEVDEWVEAFEGKVRQIAERRCEP